VRRAILMAIDRESLAKNMVAGTSYVVDGHCYPEMFGCAPDFPKLPAYDPKGAKKLLAEAGYADGFDLTIVTRQLSREAGIAVSGMLNEVGIRAKVNHMTMVAYQKLRQQGGIQAIVADMPVGGAAADASNPFRMQLDSEAQAYTDDPRLFTLHQQGLTTIDLAKRQAIYREMHQIMERGLRHADRQLARHLPAHQGRRHREPHLERRGQHPRSRLGEMTPWTIA